MVVWRRAPFRLNIATHSLSGVRAQSGKDLFLPLTGLVPQTGLATVTLLIYGSSKVLLFHILPLFLVSPGHIFKKVSNVSLPSRLQNSMDAPVSQKWCSVPAKNQGYAPHSPLSISLLSKWVSVRVDWTPSSVVGRMQSCMEEARSLSPLLSW